MASCFKILSDAIFKKEISCAQHITSACKNALLLHKEILNYLALAILICCFSFPQSGLSQTEQSGKVNVLILTGNDYPGHEWRKTAPVIKKILEEDPRISAKIFEEPNKLGSLDLSVYDTIILHFMNWETPSPGTAARENLQKFVKNGKGLMLIHFACGAWQDWDEFKKIAGRVYDPRLRPHDPRGKFTVRIIDKEHPITRGMKDFETDDELYTCLNGDTPIHIIAVARSKVDQKDYPMGFTLNYGKGRIFHTVLGHDVRAVTNSAVPELFRRGCLWTAGIDPDKK